MIHRVAIVILVALWFVPPTARADCELTVRLTGCVQDATTRKPLLGARVFYGETVAYTDDRGCFDMTETSVVQEGNFFPNNYCIRIYKPGWELVVECERRESFEPFPPCIGSAPLYLSMNYGIILVPEMSTDISDPENSTVPNGFELHPNYPNPFNPATVIGFTLGVAADVRLDVFDLLGRHVIQLHEGRLPAGRHDVRWEADQHAAGVYLYKLHVNGLSQTRKMVLLK